MLARGSPVQGILEWVAVMGVHPQQVPPFFSPRVRSMDCSSWDRGRPPSPDHAPP